MNIAIFGLGEVGSAIKKLVDAKHQSFIKELKYDHTKNQSIDILHVCIPFTSQFEKLVTSFIKTKQPNLTIINSTVKPGTTNSIHLKTGANLAHAPIDGVHPNLYDYLFKFTKPIGAVNPLSYRLTRDHFQKLGVKTAKFSSPLETELAKVFSTTYYGWNIIFQKWVHQVCQDQGADFANVYTRYNQFYNHNYKKEKPEVVRPTLRHHDGPIGGHCVIPNAQIINEWLSDEFSQFLLDQNQRLAKSSKKT